MDVQRKKKSYYQSNGNNQKRRKQFSLEPGLTGFLCTCNFREKDCVRDAYRILNEFADQIYGSENTKDSNNDNTKATVTKDDSVSDTEQDDDDDISTSLTKEINQLKAVHTKFQVVDTGVKNVIFIRSSLSNPLELVTKIFTELVKTKEQRTRYILRLLPIEVVCKAYMNDIKQKADAVLEKYFAQEPKTFSIVFNRHSNHNIQREEVIKDLAEIISKKNPGNKADLKNPELAVVVEVIRGVCLISVAPNYYKFKKYNLLEVCNVKESENSTKKIDTDESIGSKDEEKDSENKESLTKYGEEDSEIAESLTEDAEKNSENKESLTEDAEKDSENKESLTEDAEKDSENKESLTEDAEKDSENKESLTKHAITDNTESNN